jgi:hypothetical protein
MPDYSASVPGSPKLSGVHHPGDDQIVTLTFPSGDRLG